MMVRRHDGADGGATTARALVARRARALVTVAPWPPDATTSRTRTWRATNLALDVNKHGSVGTWLCSYSPV